MNNPTSEQVDRYLAEMLDVKMSYCNKFNVLQILWEGEWFTWSPTTDLNQIFKYLLPVLRFRDFTIITDDCIGGGFTIILDNNEGVRVRHDTQDPDKIPETICKAILEACSKTNPSQSRDLGEGDNDE